jgi:hypothetical protein
MIPNFDENVVPYTSCAQGQPVRLRISEFWMSSKRKRKILKDIVVPRGRSIQGSPPGEARGCSKTIVDVISGCMPSKFFNSDDLGGSDRRSSPKGLYCHLRKTIEKGEKRYAWRGCEPFPWIVRASITIRTRSIVVIGTSVGCSRGINSIKGKYATVGVYRSLPGSLATF